MIRTFLYFFEFKNKLLRPQISSSRTSPYRNRHGIGHNLELGLESFPFERSGDQAGSPSSTIQIIIAILFSCVYVLEELWNVSYGYIRVLGCTVYAICYAEIQTDRLQKARSPGKHHVIRDDGELLWSDR